jgi:2'-5' RNA ligase
VRLFIAIALPDELKIGLERLRTDIPGVRWLPAEQIHLTLAFLGETDAETAAHLSARLGTIQADAFELSCGGIGCFPDRRRPRVVWVGVKAEPKLLRLAASVQRAVRASGIIPEDRPFSPHITIARLKLPAADGLDSFLDRHNAVHFKPFAVSRFTLFQSRLTPQGAVHSPVRNFPLQTA